MTRSKDHMWEVMNCCVILHNMITESELENPLDEKEKKVSYYRHGPLMGEDDEREWVPVPASWAAYLAISQEIRDPQIHQ